MKKTNRHSDTDQRVLRQMNVALGKNQADRGNLAFNQLRATQAAFQEGSGPVQQAQQEPLLLRILGTLLTLVGLVCLMIGLREWNGRILGAFVLCFLLRLLLTGLSAWRSHRAWLRRQAWEPTQAQRAEARRTRTKWVLLGLGSALVLVALVVGLGWLIYVGDHPSRDLRVCLVSPALVDETALQAMETALSPLVGDRDGNGEEQVSVDLYLSNTAQTKQDLEQQLQGAQYPLYLVVDLQVQTWDPARDLALEDLCQSLTAGQPTAPYFVDLSDSALVTAADLDGVTLYGCIPQALSPEETQVVEALLAQLLGS